MVVGNAYGFIVAGNAYDFAGWLATQKAQKKSRAKVFLLKMAAQGVLRQRSTACAAVHVSWWLAKPVFFHNGWQRP